MPFTVKELATLSGVSVRTLHYYDEIGLLKPAHVGENNYRYYETEQLLMLQQILFYRELEFSLSDIQQIICNNDFDKVEALQSHKRSLLEKLDRTHEMIKTIDKTISHLRGKQPMKLEEIFHGFDAEKQKMYEAFLVDSGVSQVEIDNVKDKVTNWPRERWMENKRQGDEVYAKLVKAIHNHLPPSSPEVQKIINKHYQLTKEFWTPTRETYIGLSHLYASHPDFVKFYHDLDPALLAYLTDAMKIYAENELS